MTYKTQSIKSKISIHNKSWSNDNWRVCTTNFRPCAYNLKICGAKLKSQSLYICASSPQDSQVCSTNVLPILLWYRQFLWTRILDMASLYLKGMIHWEDMQNAYSMHANTSKNELGKNNTGRIIMSKIFLYRKTNWYIRREVTKIYWVFTCVLNTLHTFTLFNPQSSPRTVVCTRTCINALTRTTPI